ncbi:hypothetical protein ABRQ00_22605 [Pectobacterium aroidearum]|uniref:hypothetical protein n=1 Tax=Pectobacterium aroidearum TaxID=1201031 RepID=UPI002FCBFD9A
MDNQDQSYEFRGKIAFIFPNKDGETPVLNFNPDSDGFVRMNVGIAFVDLDASSAYLPMLKLYGPSGDNVLRPMNNFAAVPVSMIDPEKRTSFLSVRLAFPVTESGIYRFECSLLQMLQKTVDVKDILFNILIQEQHDE